jgi:hypothetical protein
MWNINVGVSKCESKVHVTLSYFLFGKVLVIVPSDEMLADMLANIKRVGSNAKRGEAGFINKSLFSRFPLPFFLNVLLSF